MMTEHEIQNIKDSAVLQAEMKVLKEDVAEIKAAVKELLKMLGMTESEMRSLLHMVGGDWTNNEPGWRNYAVLPPTDQMMQTLIKKRLVKLNGVYQLDESTGNARSVSYSATPKGMKIAKALYWAVFGKMIADDKKKDLTEANNRLYDNSLEPVVHY